jgi:hypothetical protein
MHCRKVLNVILKIEKRDDGEHYLLVVALDNNGRCEAGGLAGCDALNAGATRLLRRLIMNLGRQFPQFG